MAKENTLPYKGARDFYPEDKKIQNWMFEKWRRVVEGFGYQAYDAPILEPTDLYRMKGSDEIVNEQTYTFEDRGGRSVTLRTEMTPTVSRMVAGRRQELSYPLRWYSIPNCWRYERAQKGRLREFWQLNVDLFGVEDVEAEIEMIQIVDGLFKAFKAKRSMYTIHLNSRVIIAELLSSYGITQDRAEHVVRLIDKIKKLPSSAFATALDEITGNANTSKNIIELLKITSLDELPETIQQSKNFTRLSEILTRVEKLGITNVVFDITLMRGFDYYTDIVFEVTDNNPDNGRAMFGGGRYDGLVGLFGVEPVPTVGFGMGDVTFQLFLESHDLLPNFRSLIDVRILTTEEKANEQAMFVANELREMGANVSADYSGRKLDKQMKQADKSGVSYVVFVGSEATDQYVLKDLKSGKESKHGLERIASIVCKR